MSIWAKDNENRFHNLNEITEISDELADDALEVLAAIARRMRQGQKEYGHLDLLNDKRDWRKEMREELMDTLVYMAAEEVQEKKRRGAA